MAKIDPYCFGVNERNAFDKALSKLSTQADSEKTCLYQEDMHFYGGRDIDLVFPNAKVWVAHKGLQFLSHNWFRAMQTYDIALAGHNLLCSKTGDKVRIYSDGVKGLVVEQ